MKIDPEAIARKLYGMTKKEAHRKGVCLKCKEPAIDKCHTLPGHSEYQISGICEDCVDEAANSW